MPSLPRFISAELTVHNVIITLLLSLVVIPFGMWTYNIVHKPGEFTCMDAELLAQLPPELEPSQRDRLKILVTIPEHERPEFWLSFAMVVNIQSFTVSIFERILPSLPENHPKMGLYRLFFSHALQIKSIGSRSSSDLDHAIMLCKQNLQSLATSKEGRSNDYRSSLELLSSLYQDRLLLTGSPEDLEQALEASKEFLRSDLLIDFNTSPELLVHMSGLLTKKFLYAHSLPDLDQAIEYLERCVSMTDETDRSRIRYTDQLSYRLRLRFEYTRSKEDIDRSVELSEECLATLENKGDSMLPLYFGPLSHALHARAKLLGCVQDLDRAVEVMRKAVSLNPKKVSCHTGLAFLLYERYEMTGSLNDLDEALLVEENLLQWIPKGDRPKALASYLHHIATRSNVAVDKVKTEMTSNREEEIFFLGRSFTERRTRGLIDRISQLAEGSSADLDQAVTLAENIKTSLMFEGSDRAEILNVMSHALGMRFDKTGSLQDLEKAADCVRQAFMLISKQDRNQRAKYAELMSRTLIRLFERTKSLSALQESIDACEEVLEILPGSNLRVFYILNVLSVALTHRFKELGNPEDFERAIASNETIANNESAPPLQRLLAAEMAATELVMNSDYERAVYFYRIAVNILPLIRIRHLDHVALKEIMRRFSGVTARAVSLALRVGIDPVSSLQLLELGRGVITGFQSSARSDISELERAHPELAREFNIIRLQLDNSLGDSSTSLIDENGQNRRELSAKLGHLLNRVRGEQGFERFLLAPSESEIRTLACHGPIVVFNVSEYGNYAFIVKTEKIFAIELPLKDVKDLEKATSLFQLAQKVGGQLQTRHVANVLMRHVLEFLWDNVASSVMEALGYTSSPTDDEVWPRVWWISSGILTLLPIQAAGFHDSLQTKTVIDRVISCHSPTLKALRYARQCRDRVTQSISQVQKILFIGMSTTTGYQDLPGVSRELETLQRLGHNKFEITVKQFGISSQDSEIRDTHDGVPDRENVLLAMKSHGTVHFACHGESHLADPSRSMLVLHDWETSPLTASDLWSLNLEGARLAFLSACRTADTPDIKLLDESIHLCSAFQLAGYSSVIGSLWEIQDDETVGLVEDVYTWMLHGGRSLQVERAAEGLHRAVLNLRERTNTESDVEGEYRSDPYTWAGYIYVGA
jgi:tetratricopeptide (TPR) repeat protein